jgi:hypothetical protein
MRIFKTRALARFTKREAISDESLVAAIETAKRGLVDADLGGGLINNGWRGRDKAREAIFEC